MAKMKIDIHADDYALTPNTSKDMIECMKAGKLNSISIVPNTKYFSECMDMLYEAIPSMPFLTLMSVHIDLVEGSSLTGTSDEISIYKNEDGRTLLNLSWGKLFALSYLIGRKNRIYKCLEDEIAAQIKAASDKREIPVYFDPDAGAMQDVIRGLEHKGKGFGSTAISMHIISRSSGRR